MKQIKTIIADTALDFDGEVNTAIEQGWQLVTRRAVLRPDGYFYAEMERDVITEDERCCENCKYYDHDTTDEPCFSCLETASKWEAEE